MNKIDLIIDALERANELWLTEPIGEQALAAARELRDAESKKAQWGNPKYLIEEAVLAEREACAALCLEPIHYGQVQNNKSTVGGNKYVRDKTAQECANAIRARSELNPAFKNYMDDNWAGIV